MHCINIKICLPSLVRGRLEKKAQSSEEYVDFYWKFEHTKVTEDKVEKIERGIRFEDINMWLNSHEDTDERSEEAEDYDNKKVSYSLPEEKRVAVEEKVTNLGDVTEERNVTKDGSVTLEEDNNRGWLGSEGSYSPKKAEILYMRRFSKQPNRENRSQGPNRSFSFPPSILQHTTTHFSSPSSLSLPFSYSYYPSLSSSSSYYCFSSSSSLSYSSPSSSSPSLSPSSSSSSSYYYYPSSSSHSSSSSPSSSTLSSLV